MSLESIIVTITPDRLREIQRLPVIPAHAVYRMGRGPHLFRANGSSAPRGGMMLLDCRTFDGLGAAPPFCQEVIQECSARGFTGVVCDFEAGRLPPLEQVSWAASAAAGTGPLSCPSSTATAPSTPW